MLRHYLRFAVHGLARQKLYSILAIAVLTLGLTCFIGAAVFVLYLDSYDSQFRGSKRLQVVYEGIVRPLTGFSGLGPGADSQLAEQLALVAPELETIARRALAGNSVTVEGGQPRPAIVSFADPAWAELFEREAVAGDPPAEVLAQPRGAIVTEEAARQLFGSEPALGKTFTISDVFGSVEVTVGSVVKPIQPPSHLAGVDPVTGRAGFEIAASWGALEEMAAAFGRGWNLYSWVTTYALLPADGSLTRTELNRRLRLLGERLSKDPAAGGTVSFEARPVSRVVKDGIQSQLRGSSNAQLPVPFTTILLGFAGLVLGIACLNFVNLATARSASRAREIGVRKSLGARGGEVLRQDLVETAVSVALSIVLALAVLALADRFVEQRWQATLALPWGQPAFWLLLGALLAAVTALAGVYPAAVLARIRPLTALRLGFARAGPKALRTTLVGVQCAAATFLVFAVVVFHLQTAAIRRAALSRFDDPYVVLGQPWRMSAASTPGYAVKMTPFDTLATELGRGPGIVGVAAMNRYPWQPAATNGKGLGRAPDSSAPFASNVGSTWVTAGYREMLDIPLLAGRWFADDRADEMKYGSEATGPQRVVLDERAVRSLGFASPADAVGKVVYGSDWSDASGEPPQPQEVIGVVGPPPFVLRSARVDDGFVYRLGPNGATFTLVRLDRNRIDEALAHIETVRQALAPSAPAGAPPFLDQAFETAYDTFTRVSNAVTILAAFATAIAAVGLFGMASFLADRRTREIGLRKTQGATTRSILRLLLTDFSKPVLIANVAIWPLAYIAARNYVNLFVERMSITPLPFVATLAATLLLAWLVIGARVVRAARVNPTVALRHE